MTQQEIAMCEVEAIRAVTEKGGKEGMVADRALPRE